MMCKGVDSKPVRTRFLTLVAVACLAMPLAAQENPTPTQTAPDEPAAAAAPQVYRDKTLIEIDGRAERDGTIEVIVQPNGEDAKRVTVNILAKTKPKKITQEIMNQLEFALGDRYKVKRPGDVKVRVVTTSKKVPPVSIALGSQNLPGVSVKISNG